MFALILLPFAITATNSAPDAVSDPDRAPTVVIPIDRYDLSRPRDIERLKLGIHSAARSVCDHGYRGVMYLETACAGAAAARRSGRGAARGGRSSRACRPRPCG